MATMARVNFFRVTFEGGSGVPFRDILKDIGAREPHKRNEKMKGDFGRLQTLSPKGRFLVGTLVRIRMEEAPRVADLSGGIDDLNLADNQGVGEETYFLYDHKYAVLSLVANASAFRPSGVARYFEGAGPIDELTFEPVLNTEAYKKMAKMGISKGCYR